MATLTVEMALQGLQNAGDAQALLQAIEAASFLDNIPGEDRQRLRAARTRLRKLAAEEAKAAAEAANNGAGVERSPHAKATYSAEEFEGLAAKYGALKWRIISKPGGAVVKPDPHYRLYGLHMQATQGDNAAERPMWAERGGLDFEGRARWDAWEAVKGTPAADAKVQFVRTYWEFPPSCLYADTRAQGA